MGCLAALSLAGCGGEVVTGSFDDEPLTHKAKKDCHITTEGQQSAASPDSLRIRQAGAK